MAKRIINPNLLFLHKSFKEGKRGVILEGSSRSGKTFSSLDFIIYLCSTVENNATINIIKETYNSFKTTLYDDFNRRLPDFGLYSPFAERQEVKSFKLFGNKINLLGADNANTFHGASCDYFYVNEALDVAKNIFDQAEMRCRKFFWMDYNPKYTDHWIYNSVEHRPDVGFLKTTFKDNPHISPQERAKILSYEPTEINLKHGTADNYMWSVYGLGERMAPEGIIFHNVTWVNEFPVNVEKVYYGSDFGYTVDPSVIVKVGIQGNDMFIKYLFYQPTPTATDYIGLLANHITKDDTVWADPSGETGGRGYISEARRAGYRVFATNTFPGSIKYGLSIMKKYNIHVVESPEARKEFTGYVKAKAKVNGVMVLTDDPIDGNNHGIDACRMTCISNRL